MRLNWILIALLIMAASVLAGERDDFAYLEKFLSDKLITDFQLDAEYVNISLVRNGVRTEDLAGCEMRAYPQITGNPRGRFPMQLEVYRDGAMIEKSTVSLDVRIFADLPVPVENIKRHQLLDKMQFATKRFDVTSLSEQYLDDVSLLDNRRATQDLKAGRMVPVRRIEAVPDIERDQRVTIIAGGTNFRIKVTGMALQDGCIGETIKVKNIDSRKILSGTITAPGVVEVAI